MEIKNRLKTLKLINCTV